MTITIGQSIFLTIDSIFYSSRYTNADYVLIIGSYHDDKPSLLLESELLLLATNFAFTKKEKKTV